jgi:hypothetical protein
MLRLLFAASPLVVLLFLGFPCSEATSSDQIGSGRSGVDLYKHNVVWSPNGRFFVQRAGSWDERFRLIFLTDTKTGKKDLLYRYLRGADILWPPSSDAVIVNDWYGSSATRSVLFVLVLQRIRIDLSKEFRESPGSRRPRNAVSSKTIMCIRTHTSG